MQLALFKVAHFGAFEQLTAVSAEPTLFICCKTCTRKAILYKDFYAYLQFTPVQ